MSEYVHQQPLCDDPSVPVPHHLGVDIMREALQRGDAVPLTESITDHVLYGGHWWMATLPHSWMRTLDPTLIAILNRHHRYDRAGPTGRLA